MTVVMYGGSPMPTYLTAPDLDPISPRVLPFSPLVVYPEDVARQLRELREMVQALRGDKSETVTPAEMVRRMLGAVVDADPAMLSVIDEFLRSRDVP